MSLLEQAAERDVPPAWWRSSPQPFDERRFPCAPPYRSDYDAACRRGEAAMAASRLVVCGLARDVARTLPEFIARVDRLGRLFAELAVVVYENDSADETPRILAEWAAFDPRVTAVSERLGARAWGQARYRGRTEQLAAYRNRCRDIALARHGGFDYMLFTDLDMDGWSVPGLTHTFGQPDWDVVGANGLSIRGGRPIYYDAWAFRALGHIHKAHRNRPVNLMVLPTGAPMLHVASCFGGLAVYRMDAMRAADYGGEDCEHVVLHGRMAQAGFDRIFLNPSMIIRYPDHARMSSNGRDHPRWWTRVDPSERQADNVHVWPAAPGDTPGDTPK